MFLYIVKFSFISLLIIILTHYLYKYFTSLLTTPKVKDLVFVPTKKYDELYELIKQDKQGVKAQSPENPIKSNLDMKSELKKYLNTQLSNIQQTNNIKQYNTSKLIYTDIKHT